VVVVEVMKCRSKILSLVVIGALAWTTSAIDAWADNNGTHHDHASRVPATPTERIGSCHAHSQTGIPVPRREGPPAPGSSNYKCCLTGHDSALVPLIQGQRPFAHGFRLAVQVQPTRVTSATTACQITAIVCGDPPNITALRI
jgi:hypothetical protein